MVTNSFPKSNYRREANGLIRLMISLIWIGSLATCLLLLFSQKSGSVYYDSNNIEETLKIQLRHYASDPKGSFSLESSEENGSDTWFVKQDFVSRKTPNSRQQTYIQGDDFLNLENNPNVVKEVYESIPVYYYKDDSTHVDRYIDNTGDNNNNNGNIQNNEILKEEYESIPTYYSRKQKANNIDNTDNQQERDSSDELPKVSTEIPIALFSTTPESHFGFFAPLTALLWTKMGFKPAVLAVGSNNEWNTPTAKFLLKHLESTDALVYRVPYIKKQENIKLANIAQSSRLLAGVITSISDDRYILLTDGDMWPMSKEYFNQVDMSGSDICIMNANDYYKNDTDYWEAFRYPLTNIGATRKNWRTLFKLDQLDPVEILNKYRKHSQTVLNKKELENVAANNGNEGKAEATRPLIRNKLNLELQKKKESEIESTEYFQAYLHHFLNTKDSKEVRDKVRMFDFDEMAFVKYVKMYQSPFMSNNEEQDGKNSNGELWYDRVQFLTRQVKKDRLNKYARDPKWIPFKTTPNNNPDKLTDEQLEMFRNSSLIDAHVGRGANQNVAKGGWTVLRRLLGYALHDDKKALKWVDEYQKEAQKYYKFK